MARHSAVEEKIVEKYLEAFPSYKRESCLSLYVGKALKECHAIYPQHRLSTHISLNVKKSPFFHHSTAMSHDANDFILDEFVPYK